MIMCCCEGDDQVLKRRCCAPANLHPFDPVPDFPPLFASVSGRVGRPGFTVYHVGIPGDPDEFMNVPKGCSGGDSVTLHTISRSNTRFNIGGSKPLLELAGAEYATAPPAGDIFCETVSFRNRDYYGNVYDATIRAYLSSVGVACNNGELTATVAIGMQGPLLFDIRILGGMNVFFGSGIVELLSCSPLHIAGRILGTFDAHGVPDMDVTLEITE